MTDIVEGLRKRAKMVTPWACCCGEAADEIEQLRAALERFTRNVDAPSLADAMAHITREDLLVARHILRRKT